MTEGYLISGMYLVAQLLIAETQCASVAVLMVGSQTVGAGHFAESSSPAQTDLAATELKVGIVPNQALALLLLLLLEHLTASHLSAQNSTAENLTAEKLAESLVAETLTDSKVGKLQSVGHFVSTARGSLAFDASAPFGADFVCCAPCFSVLVLVLHGASVYFCAVENAALYLAYSAENDALAAGTVFLAAGIPAAAAGNLAAAASAEF